MAELKQGWKRVKLGQVAINSTVATKDWASDRFERYIIGKHIPDDGSPISTWNPVGDAEFGSRIRTIFRAGDVICTTRGPKLKVAVPNFDGLSAHTNFILRTKDANVLLQAILEAVVRSDGFQEHLRKHFRGSTNLFVNWSDAAEYEFALPPLEEQQRLTTLLGAWQADIECFGEAVRAAKTLHGAAAFAAFSKAMPMLEIGKAVRTSAFGPRFSAQGYACNDTANAWTVRTTDFTPEAISFAQVPGATLDATVVKQHRLEDDDVLLSRSGEYAGMVRVFRQPAGDARAYIPAAFLIRFRLDPAVLLPDYLATYCQSPQGAARVRALASGSAQPNISGTAFSSLKIPVPSLSEQRSMTHELAELRTTMTTLEQREAGARRILRSALETGLQMVAS